MTTPGAGSAADPGLAIVDDAKQRLAALKD